jgi:hypothetical protein
VPLLKVLFLRGMGDFPAVVALVLLRAARGSKTRAEPPGRVRAGREPRLLDSGADR